MNFTCRRLWLRALVLVAAVLSASLRASAQQFVDDTATRFPVPNPEDYTNQLSIGDIDNDGDLDIVFANGAGFSAASAPLPQRVFINDGTGVFVDQSTARLNFNGICRGVEMGDIENDGDLDLLFVQDFVRRPVLFLNDGNGFFTNVTTQRLPAISVSSSRGQFGDIDNDGDLDIYLVNGGTSRFGCGQFRIWINNGQGFFTDETTGRHPIVNNCEPMDCIFGDIDGDFDLDVRTAGRGTNNSRLYRNNGLGFFTTVSGVPGDSTCYSYDFGDLNGDGDLDLLGANGGSGSSEILLENDGTGNYTDVSSRILTNPGIDDNDSKFFDYDNDGDLDLIIAALGGTSERIHNNNGAGTFTQVAGLITAVADSTLDIKVADLNNDGRLDIVTGQGESGNFQNRIYLNTGPQDTIPPRIVDIEQLPDTDDATQDFVIRAAILDGMTSDRNFFDKGVLLNFAYGSGDFQRVPMRYSGGQIYRGVIPANPCGGTISYFAAAKDWAGNLGEGAVRSFHVVEAGALRFEFTGGAPSLTPPCTAVPFELTINPCTADYEPASAKLHYKYGDDPEVVVALNDPGDGPITGVLPPVTCGVAANYYLSAETVTGETVYYPPSAPSAPKTLGVGELEPTVYYSEDFEEGLPTDWLATGLWHVTGDCAVTPVCEGSSWAYCGRLAACDYDAGLTDSLLTTPAITLPISDNITLSYCSTFQREAFGTADWPSLIINGDTIDEPAAGNVASSPWVTRTVDLTARAGEAITLQWRFNTVDAFGNSSRGWQIDNVVISSLQPQCHVTAIRGDLNFDGIVNGADISAFVDAAIVGASDPAVRCAGDFDGDADIDLFDAAAFAQYLIQ